MKQRIQRHPRLIGAIAALAIATAACGGGDASGSKEKASGANEVEIRLVAFKPEKIAIKAGQSVTWTQLDPGTHTVTSGTVEQGASDVTTSPDGKFDSGNIAKGKTFSFEFADPGTYPYFCVIHPATMRGEVEVA